MPPSNDVPPTVSRNLVARLLATARHVRGWLALNNEFMWTNPDADQNSDQSTYIYCIHGTADFPNSFHYFGDNFLKQYAENEQGALPNEILGIKSLSFTGRLAGLGIDDYASQALAKIEKDCTPDPLNPSKVIPKKIVLIGHSRGGVVAEALASLLEKRPDLPQVTAVMAIAAPFGAPMPQET